MKTLVLSLVALSAAVGAKTVRHAPETRVYEAQLAPINSAVTKGKAGGVVRFTIDGDRITIETRLHGVARDIEHWQHFHGFVDGGQSRCPDATSDANKDGFIDIKDTESSAGTTMVPFNADPVGMDIPTDTYPHANSGGQYAYTRTVSLGSLQKAFGGKYAGQVIDLDHRVAMVHGVPESMALPATVASLGTIPARVTLPIACGAIKRIK